MYFVVCAECVGTAAHPLQVVLDVAAAGQVQHAGALGLRGDTWHVAGEKRIPCVRQ